jgi:rhodanese-related sulfurtransferase
MPWNMFSRFGDGSDSDIVGFGELEKAIGANAWTVVDLREPHEFGHIPNAVNMPMSGFDPRELPQGKPVVLISQSGERSRNALSQAQAIGREDVRHFAGGMNAWRMDARLSGVRTVGTFDLKLELDQREGRTVSRCLLACRSPLIETIGDTTRSPVSRRIASRELELIESVLRKLFDQTHDQPQIDAD